MKKIFGKMRKSKIAFILVYVLSVPTIIIGALMSVYATAYIFSPGADTPEVMLLIPIGLFLIAFATMILVLESAYNTIKTKEICEKEIGHNNKRS